MSISVVPIIYNSATKQILRWYLLDHVRQLNDPAFKPQNDAEGILNIHIYTYRSLAGDIPNKPLLHKLQEHINTNAP